MPKFTNGISKIEFGTPLTGGAPATTLAVLGLTYEDSCKLNMADPEKTEFFSEENEAAEFVKTKSGSITLTFQIMNADTALLVALFGGSTTGTTPNKVWNMPNSVVPSEQTVKVTTQTGMVFVIPKGSVIAKLNGSFARKELFLVDVEVTALQPTASGIGRIQFIE